jgi:hypothetical protein
VIRLFKYVRPERVDILENQKIAFTPPADFNDILDTRPRVVPIFSKSILKRKAKAEEAEVLKHMPPSFHALPRHKRREMERQLLRGSVDEMHRNAESIAKRLQDDIHTGVSKFFCVLCLSTNQDNKLMWGHYADGHRGFVIEFDTQNPRFAVNENLHQIIYSDEPATYDPSVGSQGWWKVKGKEWEYENEYRIVMPIDACEKVIVNEKPIYLKYLPRECVKAIYLGLKINGAAKDRILSLCRSSKVEVFQSVFQADGVTYSFHKI